MNFVHKVFRFLLILIYPATYRAVFLGYTRIRIYLSGGQTVAFNCASWEVNLTDGNKRYSFTDMPVMVGFDVKEIIGIKECLWW